MTVKLKRFRFGPGYYQSAGTILDLAPEEERALVDDGLATRVERATVTPPENAAQSFDPHPIQNQNQKPTRPKGKRR